MSKSTNLSESYIDFSVSKSKEIIENNTNLFILDVRSKTEYEEGHIKGAYLIPHLEIIDRQDELPENRSQPILVYCRSGGRSANASNILDSLNFTRIYNMVGGFTAWENADYPFEIGPFVKPNTNTTVGSTSVVQTGSSSTTPATTPAFEFALVFQGVGLLLIIWKKQQKKE